jgi:hypothetical protein
MAKTLNVFEIVNGITGTRRSMWEKKECHCNVEKK